MITSTFQAINPGSIANSISTGVNVLTYPFMSIIIKFFIVMPVKALNIIMQTIAWLSGTQLSDALFGQSVTNSHFFKVFLMIALFSIFVFIGVFIYGYVRAYIKRSNGDGNNIKENVSSLFKRSTASIITVIAIPIGFVIALNILNKLTNIFSNIMFLTNGGQNDEFQAITKVFQQASGNSPQFRRHFDFGELQRAIISFNIWSTGYDINLDTAVGKSYARAILQDGHDLNKIVKLIARDSDSTFYNHLNITSFADNPLNFGNLDKWNILLPILAALISLYLMILFVVSVVVKILELYSLVLFAPIIIFGKIAMEKSQGKWIVRTFHKALSVNIALLGYYLFNFLYILILKGLSSAQGVNFSVRVVQFIILFAGLTFINLVPQLMLRFLNSDEQVTNNEFNHAKSTLQTVVSPITTAASAGLSAMVSSIRTMNNAALGQNKARFGQVQ